ncbi:hypothetical protein ES332_D09G159800v1 [Gossypium tomentosum]|uniref:non-specific serine/threonine protein kinase n=1 Tax=Gossypium tomentosum TaxID=34277 RepID=A0A5D2JJ02_GOSTO|nr:hypothetical protein ES332_D09G159800v1 [Gossypium tomentosum]
MLYLRDLWRRHRRKKFWVTLTFSKRVSIERVVGSYKWRSYRLATLLGSTDKDHQYTHFWITFSFLVRYVENGSLANIIKPNKFGPFSESLVAVYIAQGVIHRDIKGANILTTKAFLFGVAHVMKKPLLMQACELAFAECDVTNGMQAPWLVEIGICKA